MWIGRKREAIYEKGIYQTVKETGDLIINFPDKSIFGKCSDTITNNCFNDDEITKSGLTAERSTFVNAPRIKECFLNLECKYHWGKDLIESGSHVVICAVVKNVYMDTDYSDEKIKGRYGESGYI